MATEETGAERRRVPRVSVDSGLECRLELRTRIRLVDISLSGALFASESELPIGTRGHLWAGVGSEPFSSEVQVRRIANRSTRESTAGLGATFLEMDEKSRRSLEAFLRKATQ
jgi:hypothetical protein